MYDWHQKNHCKIDKRLSLYSKPKNDNTKTWIVKKKCCVSYIIIYDFGTKVILKLRNT